MDKHVPSSKPTDDFINPRTAFMEELASRGYMSTNRLPLPAVPVIGQLTRCHAPDDKNRADKKSGWYVYYEFEDEFRPGAYVGVGVFGSWVAADKTVWCSKRQESMSASEQARLAAQIKAAQAARDMEIEKTQAAAAAQAENLWDEYLDAPVDHEYLVAKQVEPHGARVTEDGRLVIPVLDENKVISLQYITSQGKKFLPGGRTKGGWYRIGDPTNRVYVTEGFATGATIYEATGDLTYVAFNAGNLEPVTAAARKAHPKAGIIVAGDDDAWTDGNPGRAKAAAAADVHRCRVIFPEFENLDTRPTDFNDLHVLAGLPTVTEQLEAQPTLYQKKENYDEMPSQLLEPPGILGDIVAYYNATARSAQPGFAVQTAIAIGSVIMGRAYRTTKGNHTSLYMLNVAKSGTGKEHTKSVIEDILGAAGLDHLVNGSGYTSAGAVFSTLLRRPRHVTVIDEFGRYLEASNTGKNSNLLEANTQLMEAIGRCHGVMRPTSYSTMTLTAEKAEEYAARKIHNPAVTLVGMTTPVALYKNISNINIADGFLGRFVIHQSNQPRVVHEDKDLIEVPYTITNWCEMVNDRAHNDGMNDLAASPPVYVTLAFSGEALAIIRDFNVWCIELCNELEAVGLDALPGRAKEMAMRLAMIVAIGIDPDTSSIDAEATQWAVDYIKFATQQTSDLLKMRVSGSEFEAHKKEILQSIRDRGETGITYADATKRPPFSKHRTKDLKEILQSLIDGNLIALVDMKTGRPGRPRQVYVAID
ncbi:MAG: DUF3987 domain-containing protein [Pseudomonadales bacterium]